TCVPPRARRVNPSLVRTRECTYARPFMARALRVVAAVAAAACAKSLPAPSVTLAAPQAAHTRVRVGLHGDATASSPVTWHWALTAKPVPSAAALERAQGADPHFTPDVAGDYAVEVYVTDFARDSAHLTATVTAADDCAPSIAQAGAATASIDVGQAVA